MMDDLYDLERFVDAQQPVYQNVLSELRAGRKHSHWMWFIFPQIAGLGQSDLACKFAISSLDEARAYLQHPVLGVRLRECSRLVANVKGGTINEIFGYPDDLKFCSSMTLFARIADAGDPFKICLDKYFAGAVDQATLDQLGL